MNSLKDQKRWRVRRDQEGDLCMVGKHGVITQYSDGDLDVWVKNARVATKIEKAWKAYSHYDDGALFIRPFSDLNQAANYLKCGKRRQVSAEQREKLAARLATMRSLIKKPQSSVVSGT